MTDLALSPEEIEELRVEVPGIAFPDPYEVLRRTETEDGMGGTTTAETVVETGMGALATSGLQPTEAALAGRLGWSVAYVWEIPYESIATSSDRLRSGNRFFEVGGVQRGGAWAVTARAVVREVG